MRTKLWFWVRKQGFAHLSSSSVAASARGSWRASCTETAAIAKTGAATSCPAKLGSRSSSLDTLLWCETAGAPQAAGFVLGFAPGSPPCSSASSGSLAPAPCQKKAHPVQAPPHLKLANVGVQ